MSLPTRRGLSNHDQWHRSEAALEARRNLAAGTLPDSSDGASEQDDDGAPLEEDSIEDPAEGSMRQAAVATTQAADREPLSQASSRWGRDNELANGSMERRRRVLGPRDQRTAPAS